MEKTGRLYFSDEGILSSGRSMTVSDAALLGKSSARLFKSFIVGIKSASVSNGAGQALAMAFSAAAIEMGADVFFADEVTLPELFFLSDFTQEDTALVYIGAVFEPSIRFFRRGGRELSLEDEEKILSEIDEEKDYKKNYGSFENISSVRALYLLHLKKIKDMGFEEFPYSVTVNSPSARIRKLCDEVFPHISGNEGLAFHLNEDGVKVTAFTESTGYIQCEKLLLLALKYRLDSFNGKVFDIPTKFPSAAERIASGYGIKLNRIDDARLDFYDDKIILIVEILKIIQKTGYKLDKLCGKLPEYAELERYIPIEREKCEDRIRIICNKYNNGKNYVKDRNVSGGIAINDALGKIFVTPIRSGKGIMLHAESRTMETAAELCDFYENIIRDKGGFREKI